MTGEERLDFKNLREEMRGGFHDVTVALGLLIGRVDSLEKTRDINDGRDKQRREDLAAQEVARDKGRDRFMWKVGLIVSAVTTSAIVLAPVILHFIGVIFHDLSGIAP